MQSHWRLVALFDNRYWRYQRGHEVHFVLARSVMLPLAIKAKPSASDFDVGNLRSFRVDFPNGENYVLAHDVKRPFQRTYDQVRVEFVQLSTLTDRILAPRSNPRLPHCPRSGAGIIEFPCPNIVTVSVPVRPAGFLVDIGSADV